jgi:cell filamentation protein
MPYSPEGSDPHFDSSNKILRNVRDFTDQAKLDKFERAQSARSIVDLELNPVRGNFDQAHLQTIHKRIFEKVYPWAGELRQVNMSRAASYPFAMVQFMQGNLDKTFAKLASENYLKGLDADAFAGRAAYYLGELNTLHVFREGNGRTQREFIRELAAEAGHRINWNRVSREQMYEASAQSHNHGNNAGLAAVIRSAIEPIREFDKQGSSRGSARDRQQLTEEAQSLLRSTRGNIQDLPVNERTLGAGGTLSGWALAKSQHHVAIATSPNQFFVFERNMLSRDVNLGDRVRVDMKQGQAVVRRMERSRGR